MLFLDDRHIHSSQGLERCGDFVLWDSTGPADIPAPASTTGPTSSPVQRSCAIPSTRILRRATRWPCGAATGTITRSPASPLTGLFTCGSPDGIHWSIRERLVHTHADGFGDTYTWMLDTLRGGGRLFGKRLYWDDRHASGKTRNGEPGTWERLRHTCWSPDFAQILHALDDCALAIHNVTRPS